MPALWNPGPSNGTHGSAQVSPQLLLQALGRSANRNGLCTSIEALCIKANSGQESPGEVEAPVSTKGTHLQSTLTAQAERMEDEHDIMTGGAWTRHSLNKDRGTKKET